MPDHPLQVGTSAPTFALRDQHGQTVELAGVRGGPVVLVFYPFAFSRICTGELVELRTLSRELEDGRLLAVSCDPIFALRAFAEAERLEFALLSDFWPHGAVARAYGVFDDDRGCPRRSTLLLDQDGVIQWSVHNPAGQARSAEDLRRALSGVQGPDVSGIQQLR